MKKKDKQRKLVFFGLAGVLVLAGIIYVITNFSLGVKPPSRAEFIAFEQDAIDEASAKAKQSLNRKVKNVRQLLGDTYEVTGLSLGDRCYLESSGTTFPEQFSKVCYMRKALITPSKHSTISTANRIQGSLKAKKLRFSDSVITGPCFESGLYSIDYSNAEMWGEIYWSFMPLEAKTCRSTLSQVDAKASPASFSQRQDRKVEVFNQAAILKDFKQQHQQSFMVIVFDARYFNEIMKDEAGLRR